MISDYVMNDERDFRRRRSTTNALEQFEVEESDAGLMDSNLAIVIENYARLLRDEGRLTEAEQYESRGKAIRAKLNGRRSSTQ
jgi:hypothetical protein